MLDDTSRKVLLVIWNRYRDEWHKPDIKTLCRLSQRNEKRVNAAITELIAQRYIESQNGLTRVIRIEEQQRRPQWVFD